MQHEKFSSKHSMQVGRIDKRSGYGAYINSIQSSVVVNHTSYKHKDFNIAIVKLLLQLQESQTRKYALTYQLQLHMCLQYAMLYTYATSHNSIQGVD